MPLIELNGGLLGVQRNSDPLTTPGIWTPNEQVLRKRAAFSPTSLSGLVAWWDASVASSFTFSSGDVVQDWSSLVGSYTLTQATAANRPTRSGTVNGKSSVVFDGTNDSLSVASFDLSGGQKFSVWIAFSAVSASDIVVLEHSNNFNNNSGAFICFRDSSNNFFAGKNGGASIFASWTNTGVAVSTTPVATISTHDGTRSIGETMAYVNGAANGYRSASNDSNTNSNNRNDTLYVGSRAGSSFFLNGQICEIGITTTELTTAQIRSLNDYLMSKWGL